MYKISFKDRYGYSVVERFNDFMSAANYWERWADFPVFVGGAFYDMNAKEILWEF